MVLRIIGDGIGKGGEMMLESFYALYYYRYGLLGLFLYVLLILITSFKSFRIANHEEKQDINICLFYYSLAIFYHKSNGFVKFMSPRHSQNRFHFLQYDRPDKQQILSNKNGIQN